MYKITDYSFQKAKSLGVEIKPSKVKGKKLDVYSKGKKVASIGDVKYKDYPTYLLQDKTLANERRRLYLRRHEKDISKVGSKGWLTQKLLW